jgi:hypothetical protein
VLFLSDIVEKMACFYLDGRTICYFFNLVQMERCLIFSPDRESVNGQLTTLNFRTLFDP